MCEWNGMLKDLQGAFRTIRQEERLVKRIEELARRQDVDLNNLETEFGVQPALHLACHIGSPVAVRVLLKRFDAHSHIPLKAGDEDDTAFHWAAAGGSREVLKILLDEFRPESPPDLNVRNKYHRTPLHSALETGQVEAARLLIRAGADVHAQDKYGSQMIHFAAKSGNVNALELVKRVTRPSVEVNVTNDSNRTPLHWAEGATVDWLLRNGADLTVADGLLGELPLHSAAKRLHIDVVDQLLQEEGTDPFVKNKEGKTVLDFVCDQDASSGKVTLQRLLEKMQSLKGIFLSEHMIEYVARYGSSVTNDWLQRCLTAPYVRSTGTELVKKVKLLDFAAETNNEHAVQHLLHLIRTLLDGQEENEIFLRRLSSAVQTALVNGNLKFARDFVMELPDTQKVHLGAWVKELKDGFVRRISRQLRALWKDFQLSQRVDKDFGQLCGWGNNKYVCQQQDLGEQLPFAFILTWMRTREMPEKSKVEATAKFIKQENLWDKIGFRLDKKKPKRNALHWAVLLAKPDVVDKLLKITGCETEAVAEDDNERTPHELAVIAHRLFTLAAEGEPDGPEKEKLTEMAKKLESIKIKLQVESQTVRDLNDVLHRDRTLSVEALNAILVGSALLAGITFQGVLQQPTSNSRLGLNIFAAFNSMSFFFGIASAIIGATAVLPKRHEYIGHLLGDITSKLTLAAVLLIISIACVLVAFASAGFATIHPSFRYAILTTIGIGGALCVYVLALFMRRVCFTWWFTEREKDSAGYQLQRKKDSAIHQLQRKISSRFARSTAAHEQKGWSCC